MNYKLDYSKAETMQLSNDAFFYLLQEEEPLDEENLDEAQEIFAMFKHGFYIEDNWKTVENSDLIEATFVPYVEDDADFDECCDLTQFIQLQIKWLDASHIRLWWYYIKTGARELRGDFEVYTNKYGNRCFQTGDYTKGKGCLFFLKHFRKKSMARE